MQRWGKEIIVERNFSSNFVLKWGGICKQVKKSGAESHPTPEYNTIVLVVFFK